MKANLQTKSVFVGMVLLTVAALATYAFLFNAMKKSHERITAYTQDVERAEKASLERSALKRVAEEIAPNVEKIRTYYVSSDGVVDFIEMLEGLGKNSGVVAAIDSVNVVPSTASSSVESLSLSITFQGSWKNTMHFVTLLESLPYDISISRLSLSANASPVDSTGSSTGPVNAWGGKASFTVVKQK